MADEILLKKEETPPQKATVAPLETNAGQTECSMPGKGWFKGPLGMAVCCAAPLLLVAAISFFGLSLGAIASGALSLAVILACPVGMYLMMRMMMKGKK